MASFYLNHLNVSAEIFFKLTYNPFDIHRAAFTVYSNNSGCKLGSSLGCSFLGVNLVCVPRSTEIAA